LPHSIEFYPASGLISSYV